MVYLLQVVTFIHIAVACLFSNRPNLPGTKKYQLFSYYNVRNSNQKYYICFSVENKLIYQNSATGDEDDNYGVSREEVVMLKKVINEVILKEN
jgi:hypothetical protein